MNNTNEKENCELEQFACICTHDLKEPLRTISNFVQLLFVHNSEVFDDKSMEYITHILRGINRMDMLIRSIFAYSQVSYACDEYCEVNLNSTTDDVKDEFVLLLHDVDASIHTYSLPTIWGHSVQMYQLFSNLIGNAIKFRGLNPLAIHIFATEHAEMWEISVKDNGIGIDVKYHQQVFDVFKRLNSKHTHEGSGIGLSICKRIVHAHEGEITVHSNLTGGCEFKIKLPKARKGAKGVL